MLIKTLLATLVLSISAVYGQNSNVAANAANRALEAADRAANVVKEYANRAVDDKDKNDKNVKPTPTPTPVPSNTTIRGKVFFEDDGKPLRRSVVVFFNERSMRAFQTVTDENGNFETKSVITGSYYPMVFSSGIVNFLSSIDFGKLNDEVGERDAFNDAVQGFQEIRVDGNTNLEVKIPVKRGGSVSGTVSYADGSPAARRSIQIFRKVNGKLQSVISGFSCISLMEVGSGGCNETDDRGWYRFVGLPAGEYFIRVNEPALHGSSLPIGGGPEALAMMFGLGGFLNTYYPNTIMANQAEPINIELGKERSDVNITIPDWKLYKISGKVVSEKDGKPIRATVIIVRESEFTERFSLGGSDPSRNSVETDGDGNWAFKEVPNGKYTLVIRPNNDVGFEYGGSYTSDVVTTVEYAANVANVAVASATKVSNSNRETPKASPPPNLPSGFSRKSTTLTVENSNLENIEIRVGKSAWILGTVIFPSGTESDGRLKITALDENDVSIESTFIYTYGARENKTANSTKSFELKNLPKGRIKLRLHLIGTTSTIKSATANGVDLLNNFIELKEGQVLSNVKIILEKKE